MKNEGVSLLKLEQAIADFEGQWKGRDFYVLTAKTLGSRRGFFSYPFRTDYVGIFLALEGDAVVNLNQTEVPLKKNTLLMVSPHTVRDLTHATSGASVIGLIFTRNFLVKSGIHRHDVEVFDFFLLRHNPHLQLEQKEADILTAQIQLLQEKSKESKDKPFIEEVIRHHFLAFLYELASLNRKYLGNKVKRTRKEELHLRFHQLLSEHVTKERSVRFYAAKLFVTPKYLTETVKEVGGKTAGEMIDEMVMREAKSLLRDPALSVSDVAGVLHFSDQFFFRKFFKRHEGLTPSEYRKGSFTSDHSATTIEKTPTFGHIK
jgi:AraC family transcriptional activator of pobA